MISEWKGLQITSFSFSEISDTERCSALESDQLHTTGDDDDDDPWCYVAVIFIIIITCQVQANKWQVESEVVNIALVQLFLSCVAGMTAIMVATSRAALGIVTMIVMVTAVDRIAMVTKTATTTEDTTEIEKSRFFCRHNFYWTSVRIGMLADELQQVMIIKCSG